MDYPCANFDTIWSSNVNTTNIFQFLTIFAQNSAILPQKREVPHFQEVYQTFLESVNPKDEIGIGHLLSSKNSHGGQKCDTRASTIGFRSVLMHFQFLHNFCRFMYVRNSMGF